VWARIELLNSQKLMLEYEKYNELQAKSQRMQEDYENQLRELEKSKQGGLEELTEFYEAKLRETCLRLEQVPPPPLPVILDVWPAKLCCNLSTCLSVPFTAVVCPFARCAVCARRHFKRIR